MDNRYHISESYGATTEIFSFLRTLDVTQLQGLNRLMYKRGIARVQMKFGWEKRWFYFTDRSAIKSVFVYDSLTGKLSLQMIKDLKVESYLDVVQVGDDLYQINLDILDVTKYSNLANNLPTQKLQLASYGRGAE